MLASSLKGVIAPTLCKRIPKGRIASLEILIVTTAMANQIREGKTFQIESAMQVGGNMGMVLMNDALAKHVEDGLVEPQEALHRSLQRKDLLDKLNFLGINTADLTLEEDDHK